MSMEGILTFPNIKNTVGKLTFSVDLKTIWFLTSKEKYMVIFNESALHFVTHQRQVGFAFLPFYLFYETIDIILLHGSRFQRITFNHFVAVCYMLLFILFCAVAKLGILF